MLSVMLSESVLLWLWLLLMLETGSHHVLQAGLKLKILLPQPPECWDHRSVPSWVT
jgi:hypothetical protein